MLDASPRHPRGAPSSRTPDEATAKEPSDGPPQWFAMAGMATVGLTGVRLASWTVSDFLFLASSLLIVLRLLTGSRRNVAPSIARSTSPTLLIGLGLFTIGGLLATFGRSYDPASSALAIVRVWYITVIWFWTVRSVSSSVATFRRLLIAAIAGAVFHSLVGIYQDVSGANNVSPHWGRSPGWADHYADFGIAVGSFVPLMAVWRQDPTARKRRELPRVLVILVLLAGVGSSGSMTPFGATIVGTFAAVMIPRLVRSSRRRRRIVLPVLAAVVTVALGVSGVVDLPVQTRFEELISDDPYTVGSAQSRGNLAEAAIDGLVESPLIGVGLDPTSGAVTIDGDRLQIHSFYFRVAYEAGLLGLAGTFVILFIFFRQSFQLLRFTAGSAVDWLPAGLFGSFIMILVSSMFAPALYARISWLPMALISALFGMGRAGMLRRQMGGGPMNTAASPPVSRASHRGHVERA